ncbi:MAG: flagellar basal body P-ring formation chaperone FlgA [Paracoccaceae bacterium]
MRALLIAVSVAASPASADVFMPTRVIRAKEVISASDVERKRSELIGASEVVGLEARITLYPNRPIRIGDVGEPAMVERNQTVTLIYKTGGLQIVTEGRVLTRGAVGERVRVINLASKISVTGRIREDGWIEVN